MIEDMDDAFLDWIIKDKPYDSWKNDKFWGEFMPEGFYEEHKTPLNVLGEELLDLAGNNKDKFMDYLYEQVDAITSNNIKESKYEKEIQDECYRNLMEKHERMWQCELEKAEKKEDEAEEYESDFFSPHYKTSNAEFEGCERYH